MANTPGGLPYPAPTDTPDVPRDVQALALAVEAKPAGKSQVGAGSQSGSVESTVTDTPSPWTTVGTFPVLAGRRYLLLIAGTLSDGSTTNNAGCGAWAGVQVTGAMTAGEEYWARTFVDNRFTANYEQLSGWKVLTCNTAGTATVQARVTLKSSGGRATLTSAKTVLLDIGPV